MLPYIGGTVVHIFRLIYNFSLEQMPFEADWLVVVVGGYAGLGLIIYANRILSRWFQCFTYRALVVFKLVQVKSEVVIFPLIQ